MANGLEGRGLRSMGRANSERYPLVSVHMTNETTLLPRPW